MVGADEKRRELSVWSKFNCRSGNKVIQNGTVIAMDNLVEEPLVLINHLHLFKHQL